MAYMAYEQQPQALHPVNWGVRVGRWAYIVGDLGLGQALKPVYNFCLKMHKFKITVACVRGALVWAPHYLLGKSNTKGKEKEILRHHNMGR
jgi:hypothetical protein